MSTDAAGRILDAVRYLDEVLRQQDIGTVGSVQRGVRTPAFDQGRIAYDPAGTGLSGHRVHHFHSRPTARPCRRPCPHATRLTCDVRSKPNGAFPEPGVPIPA